MANDMLPRGRPSYKPSREGTPCLVNTSEDQQITTFISEDDSQLQNSQSQTEYSTEGSFQQEESFLSYSRNRTTERSQTVSPRRNRRIAARPKSPPPPAGQFYLSSWFLIPVLLALVAFFVYTKTATETVPNIDLKRYCTFSRFKSNYPTQTDFLWNSLQVGIENILNNETIAPAVFLFIYDGSDYGNMLIQGIANTSSSCFDPSLKPMEMLKEDFISSKHSIDDYGHAIVKYKNTIKEGNVLLVAKLNEIPGEAARALHAICDTHNPIVRKVIIFLTLITDRREGNPIEIAENTLIRIWQSKMKRNELDPLITRVTEQVFLLSN